MHPKFDSTGVQTHDLQILDSMSLWCQYVSEMPVLAMPQVVT